MPVSRIINRGRGGEQRLDRLHRACLNVLALVERGESVSVACREVARTLPKRSGGSFQNLFRLFARWNANGRQREALAARYGSARKITSALAAYFATVATRPGCADLRDAYRATVAAWNRGNVIPGVGSFLPHPRGGGYRPSFRANPPAFPVSYDSLISYFTTADLAEFHSGAQKLETTKRAARDAVRQAKQSLALLRGELAERAANRAGGRRP